MSSETPAAEGTPETRAQPRNFTGWMAATAVAAAGNVIFETNFDRELENTMLIIAGGVGIGTVASLLKIPSPFIGVRLAKEAATKVRAFRERHKRRVTDTE